MSGIELAVILANDVQGWSYLAEAGRETVKRYATWDEFATVRLDEMQALLLTRGGG